MFVESVMKWMERKVDQDVMDEDIGETWIEVKRRPRTRGTKDATGGQKISTDGSDLHQGAQAEKRFF